MAEIKLRHLYDTARNVDITEAVAVACDGSGYDRGQLETIEETTERTSRLIGRLVAKLHAKGLFSNEDVLGVLGSNWRVV